MVVVAGIIGHRKQVGYLILADVAFVQQIFCHAVYFVVDERAGDQSAEFVILLYLKLVLERDSAPFGQEGIACDGVERIPLHFFDAEVG